MQQVTASSAPPSSLSFNLNNQPTGYTFDPSGNMLVEPISASNNNMTYDGENRMTALSGNATASYTYDGNGLRVVKSAGGTTTVSIYFRIVGDRGIRQWRSSQFAIAGVHLQS